jgi:predicted NBD/HSP70 family sugar kinase
LERDQPKPLRVGMGTPGSISPLTGRLRNSSSVCLNDQPFVRDCEELLKREIRIENDANCLALSEAIDGAAAGERVVYAVIIGTGTGSGIAIDQRVLSGHNGIAGEWGHNPLPWPNESESPGRDCYCGLQGCVETWVSGTGWSNAHYAETGERRTAAEIVANLDDPVCAASFDRYCERLSKSLAVVINLLDPDVIVLGGGLSKIDALYHEVPARLPRYIFSDVLNTRLLPPLHGDSSGVRGAAWLWPSCEEI